MAERVKPTQDLGSSVINAAWWSMLTQLASKLIAPFTTMVLARLLTPEAFGVVALSTMVVSLSSMFSDAGFQRFLVQAVFEDEGEEGRYATVAFWTNVAVSIAIVALIAVFQDPLAEFVGCPGLGVVLVVSSFSLPLTALSGVQTSLYQKRLDFKTLFSSRFGSSLLIFAVAIPLALAGFGFWSLVMSTLASNLFLAIWLSARSNWKPSLYYDVRKLVDMLSFGVWILLESFATWLNTWLGTFVVGRLLSEMYVGYYNTSINMAASITGVVTAAILPVAFSTFAKLRDDKVHFEYVFFLMQKYLAMLLIPIAVGCLVYHELVTTVLLGEQWLGASLFFGCWMLSGCTVIVFGYLCSEAYRAFGKPRYCVFVQLVYLLPFIPTLYVGASFGFDAFSIIVPAGRLSLCIIHLMVARVALDVSPFQMVLNTKWTYFQVVVAMIPGVGAVLLNAPLVVQAGMAATSVLIYLALLYAIRDTRESFRELISRIRRKAI